MKKCLRFFVPLALVLGLATMAQAAQQPIGSVVALDGEANILHRGKTMKLGLKADVYALDIVTTGEGAKVQIMFKDSTLVSLGSNSSVSMKKFAYETKNSHFLMRVTQGIFRVITGSIVKENPENFKVETPRTTIGIRGTTVYVNIPPNNGMEKIALLNIGAGHSLVITSRTTGMEKVLTTPNVAVSVSEVGSISEPVALSSGETNEFTATTSPTGAQANATSLENTSAPAASHTALTEMPEMMINEEKSVDTTPLVSARADLLNRQGHQAPEITAENGQVIVLYSVSEDARAQLIRRDAPRSGETAVFIKTYMAEANAFEKESYIWENLEDPSHMVGKTVSASSTDGSLHTVRQILIPVDPNAERYSSYIGTYTGQITTFAKGNVDAKNADVSARFSKVGGNLALSQFHADKVAYGANLEKQGTLNVEAPVFVQQGRVYFQTAYGEDKESEVRVVGGLFTRQGQANFNGAFSSKDSQGVVNQGIFATEKDSSGEK